MQKAYGLKNTFSPELTPCSGVILEKLTVTQLVKKLPSTYWKAKVPYHVHKSLPGVPVLSHMYPVYAFLLCYLRFILILSSQLCLGSNNILHHGVSK